jgi:glycine/D-amino acid oxidase-like deaminating enzyme
MTDALSITVVGGGAIGSAVVFSLARAGFAPKLVARGEAVAAGSSGLKSPTIRPSSDRRIW